MAASGFAILNERDATLAAVARVFSRRGYANASLAEIAAEAGWPITRLEHEIGDKEACFSALFDWTFHRSHAYVTERISNAPWPESVKAGLQALLELFASEPTYIHGMLAGVRALGAMGSLKVTTAIEAFTAFLTPGFDRMPGATIPPLTSELIGMQVGYVIMQHADQDRVGELPAVLPEVVSIALMPFCDTEAIDALLTSR
jgi:AcrR family transcriptional regulator